jgi:hypothetical protein
METNSSTAIEPLFTTQFFFRSLAQAHHSMMLFHDGEPSSFTFAKLFHDERVHHSVGR